MLKRADHRCCISPESLRHTATTLCRIDIDRRTLMGKKVEVSGFKVCPGRSIVGMMEDHLDMLIEELINGDHPYPDSLKARALGVAECIAIIRNPYDPDVDLIREEAMERRST